MSLPLPTLVLIDWQEGFNHPTHWGVNRSTPGAEDCGKRLLAAWRQRGAPIIHIVHASTEAASPLHPSSPGYAPMAGFEAISGEPTLPKHVNSGFIGTNLATRLDGNKSGGVVLCGLTGNRKSRACTQP